MKTWEDYAQCEDHPRPEIFFSARPPFVNEAKDVCAVCPVKAECLELGMLFDSGIWGGLTPRERAALADDEKLIEDREVYESAMIEAIQGAAA